MAPTLICPDLTVPMRVRLLYSTSYWSSNTELLISLIENRFKLSPSLPHLEKCHPHPSRCSVQKPGVSFLMIILAPLASCIGYHSKMPYSKSNHLVTISNTPVFPSASVPGEDTLFLHLDTCSSWSPCLHSCSPKILLPHNSLKYLSSVSVRSVESLPDLKSSKWLPIMARKINLSQILPSPVRSYRVRHWLLLQTNLPSLSALAMLHPHWPSPILGSLHLPRWQGSSPPAWYVCLPSIHISTQTSPLPGGPFWPTLLTHHTPSLSIVWPHFIFFVALTSTWNFFTYLLFLLPHWDELLKKWDSAVFTLLSSST